MVLRKCHGCDDTGRIRAAAASGLSLMLLGGVLSGAALPAHADEPDADRIRLAARQAGLGALSEVPVPAPANLDRYLNPGEPARAAVIVLGKALFWDMQVGSDGQACGSCHFHAGADNRTRNQLSPGLKHREVAARGRFGSVGSGGGGGPDYRLRAEDFPFHRLKDPEDRHSALLFDSDDVVSSQGVRYARYTGIGPDAAAENSAPAADAVFQLDGANTRRVEPRNTPTVINAVFNFTNFWDGRASAWFNGVTGSGMLDSDARILVVRDGELVERPATLYPASLASQAIVPPTSDLEMSFAGRRFPDIGRKLQRLKPLGLQRVHPRDGVLGPLAEARVVDGRLQGPAGLRTTYRELVEAAFRPELWSSRLAVGFGPGGVRRLHRETVAGADAGYTQMEANFALFFGIAVQLYQATLISDQTPFDRFMLGDNDALDADALRGLKSFITVEQGGNCIACHSGPELTAAAVGQMQDADGATLVEISSMPELEQGLLVAGGQTAWVDKGFSNIGVRPSREDPGRGDEDEQGRPLAFARLALASHPAAPALPECGQPQQGACPRNGRAAVNGAFKTPGLRNVELTGPYFHNGGIARLEQAVEFYDRQGDFSDQNIADLDGEMARIDLDDDDERPLVKFLLALTDERVRQEMAPFDHPQLLVPHGHRAPRPAVHCTGLDAACDHLLELPAVGAGGRPAAGLPPLASFLGVAHIGSDDDDSSDDPDREADDDRGAGNRR